jgi:hypothetical protein
MSDPFSIQSRMIAFRKELFKSSAERTITIPYLEYFRLKQIGEVQETHTQEPGIEQPQTTIRQDENGIAVTRGLDYYETKEGGVIVRNLHAQLPTSDRFKGYNKVGCHKKRVYNILPDENGNLKFKMMGKPYYFHIVGWKKRQP